MADGAVLEMVEQTILPPAVIEDRLFNIVHEPPDDTAARAANLQPETDRLEVEISRLAEAIAEGGSLSVVVDALKEARRSLRRDSNYSPAPRPAILSRCRKPVQ
jgi:hypothetical protein